MSDAATNAALIRIAEAIEILGVVERERNDLIREQDEARRKAWDEDQARQDARWQELTEGTVSETEARQMAGLEATEGVQE